MEANAVKSKLAGNVFWNFLERCGVQLVQFIITIILARHLAPTEFGQIALLTVFIALAGVLIDSGFNMALVQSKQIDEADCSSVFWFGGFLSFAAYLVLWMAAPAIAGFYENGQLVWLLRVLSLGMVINCACQIPACLMVRDVRFDLQCKVTMGAGLCSGAVALGMIFSGCGIWTIVGQQLSFSVVRCVLMYCFRPWRPRLIFCFGRIRRLFAFGSNIMFFGLFSAVANNFYPLLIGKYYDTAALGLFNRGNSFPFLLDNVVGGSLSNVLLPVLSRVQEEPDEMKRIIRISVKSMAFCMVPLMAGLFVIARPFTIVLLTDKWSGSIIFLQIATLTYLCQPFQNINTRIFLAMGRSGLMLRIEIIKKILLVLFVLAAVKYGVVAMAVAIAAASWGAVVIAAIPSGRLLGYGLREQFRDIVPYLGAGAGMILCGIPLSLWIADNYLLLAFQIPFCALCYLGLCRMFHLEGYSNVMELAAKVSKKLFNMNLLKRENHG